MTWTSFLQAVALFGCAALGGALLCHFSGHRLRPRMRRSLTPAEQAEIAVVASVWSGLTSNQQADALAMALEGVALESQSVGAVLLHYADAAGRAVLADPPGGARHPSARAAAADHSGS